MKIGARVAAALLAVVCLLTCTPSFAAWTHGSDGTLVNAGSTNTTALNVPYPSSISSGDILLLHVHGEGGAIVFTLGVSMTEIGSGQPGQSQDKLYCKVASGSESGNMTVTGSTSNRVMAQFSRWTGGTCSPVVSSHTGSSASLGLGYASLTITQANTLVLIAGGKDHAVTSYTSPTGFTNIGQGSGSTIVSSSWDYQIQTTATSLVGGTWTISGDVSSARGSNSVALAAFSAVPTWVSSPALGLLTTSLITTQFTLSATGNVYGIAEAPGTAVPTCTQIKAGHDGTGAAAVTSWTEAVVANVADSHAFSVSHSPYDLHLCGNDGSTDASVKSILLAYKVPAITSGPTVTAAIGGGSVAFTPDSTGTVHCIARPASSSAFTAATVFSHAGALAFNSKSVTASADSLTITGLPLPLQDYDCAETNPGGNSAVVTANDQETLPPTGKSYTTLTSISTSVSSLCYQVNLTASPLVAIGDILELDTTVFPRSDPVTPRADCTQKYASDGSRQMLCYRIYDASLDRFMPISVGGLCGMAFGTFWLNNHAPNVGNPAGHLQIFVPFGKEMTPFDLNPVCTDDEGDAIHHQAVDSLPDHLIIDDSNFMRGVPSVRGVFPNLTLECCDITEACTTYQ